MKMPEVLILSHMLNTYWVVKLVSVPTLEFVLGVKGQKHLGASDRS